MQGFRKGKKEEKDRHPRKTDIGMDTEAAKYGIIIQFGSWEKVL